MEQGFFTGTGSCCGCFELRTGVLIIGIMSLIGSCLLILIAIPFLVGINQVTNFQVPSDYCNEHCLQLLEQINTIFVAIFAVCLVYGLLVLIASSLLLHGVNKQRPWMMTFYLVLLVFDVCLLGIVGVLLVVAAFLLHPAVLVNLTVIIPCAVMRSYFFSVIKNYQSQVRQRYDSTVLLDMPQTVMVKV